jgi:microcystin degradation protein MlrC
MRADGAARRIVGSRVPASAEVEDPFGRVKRQLVDQLDVCGVYYRCPPLLVA